MTDLRGNRGHRVPDGMTLARLRGAVVKYTRDAKGTWGYAAFTPDGERVSGLRSSMEAVETSLDMWRRILSRQERSCMTCRKTFLSEGPHHRMCEYCRETKIDLSGGV